MDHPRTYTPRELSADRWLHRVGLALAPAAVLVLLWAARDRDAVLIASILIYGAGLIVMLGCSALYNLTEPGPRKELFRRLDHAAIFFMIAATYTPFTLNNIGAPWGIGLFTFVWLVAIFGIAIKLVQPRVLDRLAVLLYLLMGWSVLVALDPLIAAVSPTALALLIAGGALYSLGVVFHLWDRLPYQNAIWHAFVLAGAACHYAAVLGDVAL